MIKIGVRGSLTLQAPLTWNQTLRSFAAHGIIISQIFFAKSGHFKHLVTANACDFN